MSLLLLLTEEGVESVVSSNVKWLGALQPKKRYAALTQNSLVFNGSTSEVVVADEIALPQSAPTDGAEMSISLWLYLNDRNATQNIISQEPTTQRWDLFLQAGFLIWRGNTSGLSSTRNISANAPLAKSWHHVVAVLKNSTSGTQRSYARIYIDGKLAASSGTVDWASGTYLQQFQTGSGDINIGRLVDTGGNPLDGKLSQVAIYDYLLDRNMSHVKKLAAGEMTPSHLHPIYYWPMNDGAGTTIAESVGSRSGTASNTSWSTGIPNQLSRYTSNKVNYDLSSSSLLFNGTTGRITVSDPTFSLSGLTALSAFAWVKMRSYGGGNQGRIFSSNDFANWGLYSDATNGLAARVNGVGNAATGGRLVKNKWHRVGMTWDGVFVKAFIDGKQVASDAVAGIMNIDSSLYIGNRSALDRGWDGLIQNPAVFDYALTDTEVWEDAIGQVDPLEQPRGRPVGYWNFYEPNGYATIPDLGFKNNVATITGGSRFADQPSAHYKSVSVWPGAISEENLKASLSTTVLWNVIQHIGKSNSLVWDTTTSVNKVAALLWNINTSIGLTRSLLWNVSTVASNQAQILWNALGVTGNDYDVLWNTKALAGKSGQLVWDVLTSTGKSTDLLWDVSTLAGFAGDDYQLIWNTKALAGADYDTVWNTLTSVNYTRSLLWNTRATVDKSNTALWNVQSTAGLQNAVVWDLLALANKSVDLEWTVNQLAGDNKTVVWDTRGVANKIASLLWHTFTSVNKTNALIWDTKALAGKESSLLWDVLIPAGIVGAEARLVWNTAAVANKTVALMWHTLLSAGYARQLIWNANSVAGVSDSLVWNTRGVATHERNIQWQDFVNVGKSNALLWNANQAVGVVKTALWDLLGTAGASPRLVWNVSLPVGDSKATLWDTRVVAGKENSAIWSVRAIAGAAPTIVWDVRNTAGITRSMVWDTLIKAGVSTNLLWDTVGVAGRSDTIIWNTRGVAGKESETGWSVLLPAGSSLSIPWNINQLAGDQREIYWDTLKAVGKDNGFVWHTLAFGGEIIIFEFEAGVLRKVSLSGGVGNKTSTTGGVGNEVSFTSGV